jgi:hypothetical protein
MGQLEIRVLSIPVEAMRAFYFLFGALFNDAVSSSDYFALNAGIISQ